MSLLITLCRQLIINSARFTTHPPALITCLKQVILCGYLCLTFIEVLYQCRVVYVRISLTRICVMKPLLSMITFCWLLLFWLYSTYLALIFFQTYNNPMILCFGIIIIQLLRFRSNKIK